jgi:hypothetical protein
MDKTDCISVQSCNFWKASGGLSTKRLVLKKNVRLFVTGWGWFISPPILKGSVGCVVLLFEPMYVPKFSIPTKLITDLLQQKRRGQGVAINKKTFKAKGNRVTERHSLLL